MADVEFIIHIIFRLVNFTVIMGAGWYAFNKYLYPDLKAQMHAQEHEETALVNWYRKLLQDQDDLDTTLSRERTEQQDLRGKMDRWSNVRHQEHELMMVQEEKRRKVILMRHKKQILHMHEQQLAQEILPHVVDRARKQLHEQFAASVAQESYMSYMVETIKKMDTQ